MKRGPKIKHGLSKTRIYSIWKDAKCRCSGNITKKSSIYIGRGITMCDEWINDFMTFHKWAIENGYAENLSIDRIDTNNGYYPENCRWTTMVVQQRNKRNNHYLSFNGEIKTISEWSEITNISHATISGRILRGWSTEDALTKPIRKSNRRY